MASINSVYVSLSFFFSLSLSQGKKRQYDQEVENLEKQQKQTVERMEQDHTNRLRDEAKRIKSEQDKELSKFQNMLKNRKKEVRGGWVGGGRPCQYRVMQKSYCHIGLLLCGGGAVLCCIQLFFFFILDFGV